MNSYNQMGTGFEFMDNPIIPGSNERPANQAFFSDVYCS